MSQESAGSASSETEVEPRSETYSWYVVGVLLVVYVFSFLDHSILNLMVDDLKLGLGIERDWEAAFLMGPAFAIFYTIFGIPFGRAADSGSRKHIIAFGLTIWSLMTFVAPHAFSSLDDFEQWFGLPEPPKMKFNTLSQKAGDEQAAVDVAAQVADGDGS